MFSFMDNRRGKIVSLKNVFLFLLFSLFFTPSFTFASAAEKWEILENTYDTTKKVVHLETRKISTDAANSGRYVVDVPVNAADLGSTVKRMLWTGIAISAVTALIEGVGWVIDEGSKVIKKPKEKTEAQYEVGYVEYSDSQFLTFSVTKEGACQKILQLQADPRFVFHHVEGMTCYNYKTTTETIVPGFNLKQVPNPNYDPNFKPEFQIVSDSQLGDEILGNGSEPNSQPVPHPEIITSAYNPNNLHIIPDAPAPVASDDALSSANPQPESDPFANVRPTPNVDTNDDGINDAFDPSAPSLGEEIVFPKFCEWAPSVCDFFGWVKEKPNLTPETELPVPVTEIPNIPMNADTFQATAGCPAPLTAPINFGGQSSTLQISYEPICQFAEKWSFVSPLIGFLSAAMIVVGVGRKGDEQSV